MNDMGEAYIYNLYIYSDMANNIFSLYTYTYTYTHTQTHIYMYICLSCLVPSWALQYSAPQNTVGTSVIV